MTQQALAEHFTTLHAKGDPLVLVNIWDAGSARVVTESGAKALATGSWSVAAAHGFDDGERLPLELVLANLKRIVASVDLPVSVDIEGGYGVTPTAVATTVRSVIVAGAVGINLEDQVIGGEGLYDAEQQVERIRAARRVADEAGISLFINARTDVYLQAEPAAHGETHLTEAVERSAAYAEAGASGFFVPGLRDINAIQALCERSPLPVNVMVDGAPSSGLKAVVSRVSSGPTPYRQAIERLRQGALEVMQ